jgi:Tfp pilus assembly protein PilF
MPLAKDLASFVKKVPDWGKWLGGVAALAAAVSAILLRPRPVIVVLAAIAQAVVLFLCWRLLTRTRPSLLVGGQPVREYPHLRWLGLTGITAVAVLDMGLVASVTGRQLLYYSFVPQPLFADVVISEFRTYGNRPPLLISERIEDAVEKQLRTARLQDVNVIVDSTVIRSEEQARRVARDRKAKAVIWGWHDPHGIKVNLYLSHGTPSAAAVLDEIPLAVSSVDSLAISVVRGEVVPAVTFLSLFVLGHLYHERNEYRRGSAAFDAAMQALPGTVPISDRSVVHFFRGRARAAMLPEDVSPDDPAFNAAVCDYAAAIRLNRGGSDAYNSLGVLLAARHTSFGMDMRVTDGLATGAALDCIRAAGLEELWLSELFERSRQLEPHRVLFAYNAVALRWKSSGSRYSIDQGRVQLDADEFAREIEALLRRDPSIPGPHLLLGVIQLDQGRPDQAARHFEQATRLRPSSRTRVNWGQALVRQQREEDARAQFQAALAINPHEYEARLGLARQHVRAGRHVDARTQLRHIATGRRVDAYLLQATALLLSHTYFAQGDARAAQDALQRWISSQPPSDCPEDGSLPGCIPRSQMPLEHLLLLLLSRVNSDADALVAGTAFFDGTPWPASDRHMLVYRLLDNSTAALAWGELEERCTGALESIPEVMNANDACLFAPGGARIQDVYAIFDKWLDHRLYYRSELALYGAECPFLFTYDRDAAGWQLEGTILTNFAGRSRSAVDRRRLTRFDGRVLIRELEPEVTFLDRVRVIYRDAQGREQYSEAVTPALRRVDDQHFVLRRGQETTVRFDEARPPRAGEEIWLEAEGFYLPVRTSYQRRPWDTPTLLRRISTPKPSALRDTEARAYAHGPRP